MWFTIGVYFGIAGFTEIKDTNNLKEALTEPFKPAPNGFIGIDSINYRNPKHWRAEDNLKKDRRFYKYFHVFPSATQPILALFAFVLLGISSGFIKNLFTEKVKLSLAKVAMFPLVSIAIVFSLQAIVIILPEFKNETQMSMYFLYFGFVGGFFSREFFNWFKKKKDAFFEKEKSTP